MYKQDYTVLTSSSTFLMQTINSNKNKYVYVLWLLVTFNIQPVQGQFIQTYFRLTPGVEVVHLGNQKVTLDSSTETSVDTYGPLVDFRASENLEFLVEVTPQGNQSGENRLVVRYYNYGEKNSVIRFRKKSIVLIKNTINQTAYDQNPFSASFSIPQNQSGLVTIHHP